MPSYISYLRHIQDVKDDNIESWITINGNHIPIMKGQSKSDAIKNFISKKRQQRNKNDGIIRSGNKEYGKPGRYEVYRSGNLDAPRGTIFTASDIITAHNYGEEGKDIDAYHVDIKNPLVIRGKSDVDNLKLSWKALFGKDFNESKPLDQLTWPKYDEQIARRLARTKYDALITFEGDEPKEVQLPAGRKNELEKVRSMPFVKPESVINEDIKKAIKEADEIRSEYYRSISKPYKERTEEEEKKANVLYLKTQEASKVAGMLSNMALEDYYLSDDNESENGQSGKKPEEKDFFKNSKILDNNGKLKIVYHGTESDFIEKGEDFSISYGVGFHFGTKEAARQRTHGIGKEYPAHLNITNPLKLDFDLEEWGGFRLINELFRRGIITKEQAKPIMEYRKNGGEITEHKYDSKSNEIVRKILEDAGYDGIEYINNVEDKGSTSYIAFHPEQIKIIKGD